jgi:hypothetical protein
MTRSRVLIAGMAFLITAGAAQAQVSQTPSGPAGQVVTEQLTGEVAYVQGDTLVAKMLGPGGYYRVFFVKPGREFMIDGQTKHIADLKPGTVLTATVTTTTQPVTVRTTSSLKGKVWWVNGNYVILTLENGEKKEYKVPDSYQFMVEGKPATVSQLKQGMNVVATKIVEEPKTEMSEKTVITGKAPK